MIKSKACRAFYYFFATSLILVVYRFYCMVLFHSQTRHHMLRLFIVLTLYSSSGKRVMCPTLYQFGFDIQLLYPLKLFSQKIKSLITDSEYYDKMLNLEICLKPK